MVAILASLILAFTPFAPTIQAQCELMHCIQQGKVMEIRDQWGNKFRVTTMTNINVVLYTVQSSGPDAELDTADDLYLNTENPWPRK